MGFETTNNWMATTSNSSNIKWTFDYDDIMDMVTNIARKIRESQEKKEIIQFVNFLSRTESDVVIVYLSEFAIFMVGDWEVRVRDKSMELYRNSRIEFRMSFDIPMAKMEIYLEMYKQLRTIMKELDKIIDWLENIMFVKEGKSNGGRESDDE